MNQWIENATAGRLKDMITAGSIRRATQAVLTNALYFKGAWSRKFDARLTEHAFFYLPNGSHVRVPFMSSTKDQHIVRRAGYKVLNLPYANEPGGQRRIFSMYIYLPDDHHGLPGLLHCLSSPWACSWCQSSPSRARRTRRRCCRPSG
jgi:serpin B